MFVYNKKLAALLSIFCLSFVLIAANSNDETPEQKTILYFTENLDALELKLKAFEAAAPSASPEEIKQYFAGCRALYKRVEFLIEYFYPAAANRMNGAPLLEAEASEPEDPVHPTGFQVLEEPVYEELTTESRLIIANEISGIIFQVNKVKVYRDELVLSAPTVFDALRLNLYRMIAKGISGFDCPVALTGVQESVEVLKSLKAILTYYEISPQLTSSIDSAISFADGKDFNGFNRAVFLSQYVNPMLNELHRFQEAKRIAFIDVPRAIDPRAGSFFERDAFNRYYFAPSGTGIASEVLVSLGNRLFYEPLISGNGKRSCGGCHDPSKAFTDGLKVNTSLFGNEKLLRNTPTLINAALQPAQFADSRIAFLEDQVHDVVSNQNEMGGNFAAIIQKLKKDKAYHELFESAFGADDCWTKANVKKAIAAYVRSLTALNSRFDKYMHGESTAMNEKEVHGFNVFMGKAKCGTCHYVPLFSGAVPPLYDKIESEVLGVPVTRDTINAKVDADLGKYNLYHMPHQRYSFKTPTLRNIALTAPYMHNGVYATLEEVIDFYDKGGGAGLGYELPNQTLSPNKLDLSIEEKQALVAFMKTLTDTVVLANKNITTANN